MALLERCCECRSGATDEYNGKPYCGPCLKAYRRALRLEVVAADDQRRADSLAAFQTTGGAYAFAFAQIRELGIRA